MIKVEEEKKNKFKGKNILVVGLARSGAGAANLLVELGARVSITDMKPLSSLADRVNRLSPAVKLIEDNKAGEIIDSLDMIVISPGVPLYVPLLVKANIKGVPIIGELELAYQVIKGQGAGGKGTFIGITGTNGKSTTTTLVDLMLKESGYKTLFGGNIGNALTEEILKIAGEGLKPATACPDYIVAEISSFQLETIEEFSPHIAAVLNITPDHLDRYDGMIDYINAKARIFENQAPEDYLVLNADDPVLMELHNSIFNIQDSKLPKVLFFSREKEVEGVYSKDGTIYCNFINQGVLPYAPTELIRVDEIKIQGAHNLENAMAASLMALISGCRPEAVRNVLKTFTGLEHRLEYVDDINGVRFINDSKGTNVGAVAKSLADFENVVLIMGGLDKGGDFSILGDLIKKKVKLLILIGAAADVIAAAIGTMTETQRVSGFSEAIAMSMSKASPGDIVMLSPGCASFDMFKDFEDRGRKFKEAVKAFKDERQ